MSERLHIDYGHPDTDSGKTHVLCVGNENTGDGWREVARARGLDDAKRLAAAWNALAGIETAEIEAGVVADMVEAIESAWAGAIFEPDDPISKRLGALLARLGRQS